MRRRTSPPVKAARCCVNDAALAERAEVLARERHESQPLLPRRSGQVHLGRPRLQLPRIGDPGGLPADAAPRERPRAIDASGYLESLRCRVEGLGSRPTAWIDQTVPPHCEHPSHLYYLLMPTASARTRLIEHLKAQGILAVFHYIPLNLSPMGRKLGGTDRRLSRGRGRERTAVATAVLHEPERRTIRTTSSQQFSSSECDGSDCGTPIPMRALRGRGNTLEQGRPAALPLVREDLLDCRRHRRVDRRRRRSRLPGGACRSRGQRRAASLLVRRQKRRHPLDDTPRHRHSRGTSRPRHRLRHRLRHRRARKSRHGRLGHRHASRRAHACPGARPWAALLQRRDDAAVLPGLRSGIALRRHRAP